MRELNIEQRLNSIEDNVATIKRMLAELLSRTESQSSISDNNEIMSVKQVAQFLGLDVNIIYLKCSKGDIPYFKLGRQYRFKKPEIQKWIKEQKERVDISVDDYVDRYMQSHVLKI
jgi:excisionase family DNA binding protein